MFPPTLSRLVAVVVLVALWCALWGEITVANLVSGTLLAAVFLASGIGTDGRGSIRFVPLLRLSGVVLLDLIQATITVAKDIVTPTDLSEEVIFGIELPPEAARHLLLLAVAVTVTPGTAVVDTDSDKGILYLHQMYANEREGLERQVHRLARLAEEAFPGPKTIAPAEVTS